MVRGVLLFGIVGVARSALAQPIIIEVSTEEPADSSLVDAAARASGGRGLRGAELSAEINARVLDPTRQSDRSGLETLLGTVPEGIQDFYQNRFDQAVEKLTRASNALSQAIDVVGRDDRTATALFESWIILAITLRHERQLDLARETLRRVIRTFPGRRPMLAQFSPDLIRLYDEVRSEMDGAPMADVRVTTEPAGCEVLRDGQSVGTSPWRAATYPGAHTFQARCAGRLSSVHRPTLEEGSHEIHLDPEAEAALHASPLPWIARGLAARRGAAALARALGRPEVIVVQRRRGRVVIEVVRAVSPRVDRRGEGPTADVAWANLHAPQDPTGNGSTTTGAPWFRDVGAWLSLGIGAATVVSGIALVGSAREDARTAQAAETVQEEFELANSANDSGTPGALVTTGGMSLVLGGLAALVTPASNRTTTFHGPVFWLLSAAGLFASGLGVGLLLIDGCAYDDHPLCAAVPGQSFVTNAPAGLILTASGALVLATSIVLRLTEEGGSETAP